jgi:hypothetical protein
MPNAPQLTNNPLYEPNDIVTNRYIKILKNASRPELEEAVKKGDPPLAAAATFLLSKLKGGWDAIASLWRTTPEDRVMKIYSEIVHGHPPPTFKEKITKKLFEILTISKTGLAAAGRAAGIALQIFSPSKLASIIHGDRVKYMNFRYKLLNSPKVALSGRSLLNSRYASITKQNFKNKILKTKLQIIKRLGGNENDPRIGPLLSKKLKEIGVSISPAQAIAAAAGKLSMNTGRLSTSRYEVIGTPKLYTNAQQSLDTLASQLGMTPAQVLKDPRAAIILARMIATPGGSTMSEENAKKLYKRLEMDIAPLNRVSKKRYNKINFKNKTSIAEYLEKYDISLNELRKIPGEVAAATGSPLQTIKNYINKMKPGAPRIGGGRYNKMTSQQEARVPPGSTKLSTSNMEAFSRVLVNGGTIPPAFAGLQIPAGGNISTGILISNSAKARLASQLVKMSPQEAINLAIKYRKMNSANAEFAALGVGRIGQNTKTENLMRIQATYKANLSNAARNRLNKLVSSKARMAIGALRNGTLDYDRLRMWARHLGSNRESQYYSNFRSALQNRIRRITNNRNAISSMRRLRNLRSAAAGMGANRNIESAEREIMEKMRREQNEKRRIQNANRTSRGLAPMYRNRNRGIPYSINQPTPRGYGNMQVAFEAPVNRPQYGAVPRPMPRIPNMPIMANMGRQSSPPLPQMPLENILPPAEKNAVLNVGGANKAINLVENAGGASNVVKTANIMRNVGGSPEAAVAAGANAKNVKIVLQLGGPNNAVKVAAAVPKLKRRRSKKKVPKKKAPKPARVKEIKKLLGFLGAKANLQKKLPDKNNREKKLSKKEIVGKLTRFLLRK